MNTLEVLSPRVAQQAVVGLPQLAVLILEGIAAAVDAVEVVVAVSTFDKVVVSVCSGNTTANGTLGSITLLVHIIGRGRLFPNGGEALVVDGAYLVDTAQGPVGLGTARVVVRGEEPLEVAADAVFSTLGKASLRFQKSSERLFAIFRVAMQVDGAPGTIFAIEQLVGTLQFVVVVVGRTAIGAAPVLNDIPVGSLAAIAGGDEALIATSGVE